MLPISWIMSNYLLHYIHSSVSQMFRSYNVLDKNTKRILILDSFLCSFNTFLLGLRKSNESLFWSRLYHVFIHIYSSTCCKLIFAFVEPDLWPHTPGLHTGFSFHSHHGTMSAWTLSFMQRGTHTCLRGIPNTYHMGGIY